MPQRGAVGGLLATLCAGSGGEDSGVGNESRFVRLGPSNSEDPGCVENGDHMHALFLDNAEDRIREPSDHALPNVPVKRRVHFWMTLNLVNATVDIAKQFCA
jgi:hypothetical protein